MNTLIEKQKQIWKSNTAFPCYPQEIYTRTSTDTNIHGSSSPLYNGEVQFVFHICRFCICENRELMVQERTASGQDTDKKVVEIKQQFMTFIVFTSARIKRADNILSQQRCKCVGSLLMVGGWLSAVFFLVILFLGLYLQKCVSFQHLCAPQYTFVVIVVKSWKEPKY